MSKGLPVNDAIRVAEVWLFDEDGRDLGIVGREQALDLARQRTLDLIQVDTASSPPRCRLADARATAMGAARRARAARAAGAPPKELRLRTTTGTHDVVTQVRRATGLLAAGHSVKVTVLLERAERGNPTAARALLDGVVRDLGTAGHAEGKPLTEKGALSILISPRIT